jgi:hypothetical protein
MDFLQLSEYVETIYFQFKKLIEKHKEKRNKEKGTKFLNN